MKKDITELFCFLDDFCKAMESETEMYRIRNGETSRTPTRTQGLSCSEIMTIVLMFHEEKFRNFKNFYKCCVQLYSDAILKQ
jgi:hypothetical protein